MSELAVRSYAGERHFGEATLQRWLRRDAAERDELLRLVRALRLGENQFRDLLDLLEDIAARQGTSAGAVLASAPVHGVLSRGLGRNETIKALKRALGRLRFPELRRAEETLEARVRALALPPGLHFEFPENLEGEQVTVTLRARSATEFRAQAAAVAQAARGREIDEIFAILEGLP